MNETADAPRALADAPRALIFGAEGIAGRALMHAMPQAWGTARGAGPDTRRIIPNVDITRREDLEQAIGGVKPDVVVNCAGIVKSECDQHDPSRVIAVNALAPHLIATVAKEHGCHVIHLSTDCVFDGTRGGRTEDEPTDATDLYGKSKATGELKDYDHCLTIRTSFIGNDPKYGRGILEWLRLHRSPSDEVIGYVNALWSGISAPELARVIAYAATRQLSGLYHVSGPIVSKAYLLDVLIHTHELPCALRLVDEPRIDRTLDDSKWRTLTGHIKPTWGIMARELAGAREV